SSDVCSSDLVTGDLVRLAGDLDEELGADVLDRVLELDVLGDGHAVLGDRRAAELLLQDDVAPLRPERDLDGVRDGVDAAFESAARVFLVDQVLGHVPSASLVPSGFAASASDRVDLPLAQAHQLAA